jgi:hypothetical protein
MRPKSSLILVTTLWDIVLTWFITRTLDYVVKRIVARFRLRWFHSVSHGMLMNSRLVLFYLTYFVSFKESERSILTRLPFFRKMIKLVLRSHWTLHRYGLLRTQSCRSCQIILENKNFLRQFETEEKAYPPFNFIKSKDRQK